jgi:hypothetical protein
MPAGLPVETVRLEVGDLLVEVRDNSRSPGVLSGVQSLSNRADAPGFDAFDPDTPGASAGLNFEHIISGHESPHNAFSPRHGRYDLYAPPDGRSATLVRDPHDSPWAVESRTTLTVVAPHAIDMEFRCRAHAPDRFGERGHAIFFFADYMNDVAEVPIHFLGIDRPGGEEKWIAADAPPGHRHWRGGGTYRSRAAADLEYDEDLGFNLNSWSYDYPRFTRPFYFGKLDRGMVFIIMFDRMHSPTDEIRFSLFKFKLDRFPRPAWDFQYVIHRVERDREYGFRARVVFKRFVSPEDCVKEYESWKSTLATRPAGE